jgi:hypothetical protein
MLGCPQVEKLNLLCTMGEPNVIETVLVVVGNVSTTIAHAIVEPLVKEVWVEIAFNESDEVKNKLLLVFNGAVTGRSEVHCVKSIDDFFIKGRRYSENTFRWRTKYSSVFRDVRQSQQTFLVSPLGHSTITV